MSTILSMTLENVGTGDIGLKFCDSCSSFLYVELIFSVSLDIKTCLLSYLMVGITENCMY